MTKNDQIESTNPHQRRDVVLVDETTSKRLLFERSEFSRSSLVYKTSYAVAAGGFADLRSAKRSHEVAKTKVNDNEVK